VTPYEAVPVQPVDPKPAWDDALTAGRFLGLDREARWPAPPDWPALVTGQEPQAAVAFCLGNFPQLVRDLHPLLAGGDLTALRCLPARPLPAPALPEWLGRLREPGQLLLAAGVFR